MKNTILFLGLMLVTSLQSCAQDTLTPSFDEERLLSRQKKLSSDVFEGRRTGEKGNALARAYIIEEFKKTKALPFGGKYEHHFTFKTKNETSYNGVNVLAFFKGTTTEDEYIVVSAHYDHLGVREGEIYNGADDNASGTAALLSFAEYLSKNPPKHSVILAAFDAEELGLKGASYFVDKMKNQKIVANINMDMISRSKKDELYVVGARYNDTLKAVIQNFKNPTSSSLLEGHDGTDGKQDWTYSSDHGPFHAAKIPFLYFGDEDHPAYHQPIDDYQDITPKFYKNAVQIILSIFLEVDKAL